MAPACRPLSHADRTGKPVREVLVGVPVVKQGMFRIRDWAVHAWGALSVALALIFAIPSLVAAGQYKRTPWWVWPGVAVAAIFFVVALFFFAVPLVKRSRPASELVGTQAPAVEEGTKPDPEVAAESVREAGVARERVGYRVSGRGKARPVRAHIRNQDVAFDVRDDGEVDDTDSDIG